MTDRRIGVLGSAVPEDWHDPLSSERVVLLDGKATAGQPVDVLLVDGARENAVTQLRQVRRSLPHVQPIIITPPTKRDELQREITLSPGLGEVWLATREQLYDGILDQAAQVTAQRSQHAARTRHTAKAKAQPTPVRRPVVTDTFLATVLQVAPVAVFSLDGNDRVVTINPAAERLFELEESQVVGRAIADVLRPVNRSQLAQLMTATSTRDENIEFELPGNRRGIFDITVETVPGRADVLRVWVANDITEASHHQQLLEDQAVEMERQTDQLSQQAQELEELLAARDAALKDVSHLMEARSRFYAAMNHEIRTPINAILGFNDLLLAGVYGELSREIKESVARSQRAARHLLELVNDVLDLSKIEAGRVDIALAEYHLPALITELLQTMEPTLKESGSKVVTEFNCDDPVCTDDRRIRQILMNLLSNAAKFGLGKPITVRCESLGDSVRIDVIDQGLGIKEEQLPRIFDEFVQMRERRERGTGLGLPISRKLAELLGGHIEVTSEFEKGSTFSLLLPLRGPRPEHSAAHAD